MNEIMSERIAALREAAIEYQDKIHAEQNPDKTAHIQSEFVSLITDEMQTMIAQGASARDIQEVQDILRAAFEPIPNSYAPDATETSEETEPVLDVEDLLQLGQQTFLIPVDATLISDFEAGQIDEETLIDRLSEIDALILQESLEIIDLLVNNYDSEETIFGGEILAGLDGNALVLNPLTFKNTEEQQIVICDPTVYQSTNEIEKIYAALSSISEEDFSKRFDIKKLIKAGAFDGYSSSDVKNSQTILLESAYENLKLVCEFYKTALENEQLVLIVAV